jgi:hypothetical protein
MKNVSQFLRYCLSLLKRNASAIVNDTLKKDGKWSRTSLTMGTAWGIAVFFAFYDLRNNGFHFEVFLTFVGVALGSKIVDAQTKRLEK